jgi:hypothetical protein
MPKHFAAMAAGRETYPPFENTKDGRKRRKTWTDSKNPLVTFIGSTKVFQEKYRRNFPDRIGKNHIPSLSATFSSSESASPIQ